MFNTKIPLIRKVSVNTCKHNGFSLKPRGHRALISLVSFKKASSLKIFYVILIPNNLKVMLINIWSIMNQFQRS